MKKVVIAVDANKKIDVFFSGDECITHRDLKLMTRAMQVQFRFYHYKLIHPKKDKQELSKVGV